MELARIQFGLKFKLDPSVAISYSLNFFLSDIRGLRYTGLKKVNFFVGHPVVWLNKASTPNFSFLGRCRIVLTTFLGVVGWLRSLCVGWVGGADDLRIILTQLSSWS